MPKRVREESAEYVTDSSIDSGSDAGPVTQPFGELFDRGYTMIPNMIFRYQASLDVTHAEMMLILTLLSFSKSRLDPSNKVYPGAAYVATCMGVDERRVREYSRRLRDKGLLIVSERRGTHGERIVSEYDVRPFFDALLRVHHEYLASRTKSSEGDSTSGRKAPLVNMTISSDDVSDDDSTSGRKAPLVKRTKSAAIEDVSIRSVSTDTPVEDNTVTRDAPSGDLPSFAALIPEESPSKNDDVASLLMGDDILPFALGAVVASSDTTAFEYDRSRQPDSEQLPPSQSIVPTDTPSQQAPTVERRALMAVLATRRNASQSPLVAPGATKTQKVGQHSTPPSRKARNDASGKATGTAPSGRKRSVIPDGWTLGERHYTDAQRIGIDRDRATAIAPKFVDHHMAKGDVMADWDAAWRTWCRNDIEWAQKRPVNNNAPHGNGATPKTRAQQLNYGGGPTPAIDASAARLIEFNKRENERTLRELAEEDAAAVDRDR